MAIYALWHCAAAIICILRRYRNYSPFLDPSASLQVCPCPTRGEGSVIAACMRLGFARHKTSRRACFVSTLASPHRAPCRALGFGRPRLCVAKPRPLPPRRLHAAWIRQAHNRPQGLFCVLPHPLLRNPAAKPLMVR